MIAFCLARPGFDPKRSAAELWRLRWGEITLSVSTVSRILRCHGLGTRGKRLSLVAGYAAVPEREPRP